MCLIASCRTHIIYARSISYLKPLWNEGIVLVRRFEEMLPSSPNTLLPPPMCEFFLCARHKKKACGVTGTRPAGGESNSLLRNLSYCYVFSSTRVYHFLPPRLQESTGWMRYYIFLSAHFGPFHRPFPCLIFIRFEWSFLAKEYYTGRRDLNPGNGRPYSPARNDLIVDAMIFVSARDDLIVDRTYFLWQNFWTKTPFATVFYPASWLAKAMATCSRRCLHTIKSLFVFTNSDHRRMTKSQGWNALASLLWDIYQGNYTCIYLHIISAKYYYGVENRDRNNTRHQQGFPSNKRVVSTACCCCFL